MVKRKITVTVDEEIVDEVRRFGGTQQLSAVVNDALAEHVENLARTEALREMLDAWEGELGPVSEEDTAKARAAFDELDGVSPGRATA
jgi:Arc/MetJ family transcription regulator